MLSVAAQACLLQMYNTLLARQYSVRSIRNYTQEMRFLFAHYYDLLPDSSPSMILSTTSASLLKSMAWAPKNVTRACPALRDSPEL